MKAYQWSLAATMTVTMAGWSGLNVLAAEIGDPAPPLKIAQWVKGNPVDLSAGKDKNVYVVEFWATWCGPCRASIPHLTDAQKKYKDKGVTLIGVSDEETSTVKSFVDQQGGKMEYIVACDDGRATNKAYMEAFGIEGIPHAFIIDKAGTIAWHGDPSVVMDKALDQILAGTFDRNAARKADGARRLVSKYFELAYSNPESKELQTLGSQIAADGGKDSSLMNMFSWELLTNPQIQNRDLDLAMRTAKLAYDACEGEDPAIVDTYARALFMTGKKDEAIKYQKKAIDMCKDDGLRKQLQGALDEYQGKGT